MLGFKNAHDCWVKSSLHLRFRCRPSQWKGLQAQFCFLRWLEKKPTKLPIFKIFCKNDSWEILNYAIFPFILFASYRIFSFNQNRDFCPFFTIVPNLPLCQILQIFIVNFQRYFRSEYRFCKIFEGTRSLNLHLREPGVLARARASTREHAQSAAQATRAKKLFRATLNTGTSGCWSCK